MKRWLKHGCGLILLAFGSLGIFALLATLVVYLITHQYKTGAGGTFGQIGSDSSMAVAFIALAVAGFLMLRANWTRT